jgi:hypothetical protein
MQICTTRSARRSDSPWASPAGSRQLTSSPASHQRERNRRRGISPDAEGAAMRSWDWAVAMLSMNSRAC